jgi:hypothetical protein
MEKTVTFSAQRAKKALANNIRIKDGDMRTARGEKSPRAKSLVWIPFRADITTSGQTQEAVVCIYGVQERCIGVPPEALVSASFSLRGEEFKILRTGESFEITVSFNNGSTPSRAAREIYFAR